nr:DNA repair protein rad-50-like [Penaeus vannamei]
MQKVIRNLEERIRGFDYDKLIDEKTELLQKSSRIDNQGGILDGRLQEVNKTIQTLESELRRKEIRDAEKNYKQKFVEMKCTDVAADDLNKYYKVLDTAISNSTQTRCAQSTALSENFGVQPIGAMTLTTLRSDR